MSGSWEEGPTLPLPGVLRHERPKCKVLTFLEELEVVEHLGGLRRVKPPRNRQNARQVLLGEGHTLHKGIKRGLDTVVQSISGLSLTHSSPCDPVTHQGSRDRPSLAYSGAATHKAPMHLTLAR